jgi:hypothetical protein
MTQQHRNGDTSPDRVANGDIVERLRTWFRDVNAVSAIDVMDEAANEIERLRNGAAEGRETVCQHVRGTVTQHCSLNFTLTDEEREAIYRAEARLRTAYVPDDATAATLRSLLERLRSTPQTHPTLS